MWSLPKMGPRSAPERVKGWTTDPCSTLVRLKTLFSVKEARHERLRTYSVMPRI